MAKTRRPRKVKVGATDYRMVSRSKSWGNKHKAYGMITYTKELIELTATQSHDEMIDTVIHELLHAIADEYKVKFVDGRQEERVVTKFANGLRDVFKSNPNLLDWIVARNKINSSME